MVPLTISLSAREIKSVSDPMHPLCRATVIRVRIGIWLAGFLAKQRLELCLETLYAR